MRNQTEDDINSKENFLYLVSFLLFSGYFSLSPVQRPTRRSVVCEVATTKKPDSAEKRARQAEKRRIYHKSRKSEIKTRMKKVLFFS